MEETKKPKGIRGIKISEMTVEEKASLLNISVPLLDAGNAEIKTEAKRITLEILKSIQ